MRQKSTYFFIFLFLFLGQRLPLSAQTSRIERLENLLELSNIDTTRIKVLNALYVEYSQNAPLKAKEYAEKALEISERIGFIPGIINSSDNIAEVYHSQGVYNIAIEFYIKSLDYKEKQDDLLSLVDSYSNLGKAHVQLGNYPRALYYYQRSKDINLGLNDPIGLSRTYSNMGVAYYQEGDLESAIQYHRLALDIADSLKNDPIIAINLSSLGRTFHRKKMYRDAQRCYSQLLHIGQKNSDKVNIQRAYQGLSQIYAEQGDYKKAYEYYQFFSLVKESLFRDLQTEQEKDIQNVESKLLSERQRRQLSEAEQARRTILNYFLIACLVFFLVITFVLYRNNLLRKRVNQLLEQQKEDIEQKQIKLEEQTRKIESQNLSIQRKNETLEATFREIERKNKDITASINYAKRIQESMLPRQIKITEALPEHFILHNPRDIVSGDFYWFSHKGDKTIIAAVDCTGHGVPGAIMSMLGDSYLNQIINLQNITEPEVVLKELHKNIGIALNQHENNNQDGMDVAIVVIDRVKKVMEFSGASRPMLLIRNGVLEDIQSNRLPIGGFQKDRPREFSRQTYSLDVPTWFYIFSDGFQDQFGGPRGRKFAKTRLVKTIFTNYEKPLAEQKWILEKTLKDWMGQNRQMDDILLIGVKLDPDTV